MTRAQARRLGALAVLVILGVLAIAGVVQNADRIDGLDIDCTARP